MLDSEYLASMLQPQMLNNVTHWVTSLVSDVDYSVITSLMTDVDYSVITKAVKSQAQDSYESLKDFRFNEETSFSGWEFPALTIPIYLTVIFLLQRYIAYRGTPFNLSKTVLAHNTVLSIVSLFLWLALTTEIVNLMQIHGPHTVLFDTTDKLTHGRHYAYYYVNYILKYVELLDTVLLVLQAKPVIFLHKYHHAATLLLCWVQLEAGTCMQWVVITMNLFVHVVMYSYYALSTCKKNIWWKRYLTTLQILQFVISVVTGMIMLALRVLGDLGFAWSPKSSGNYPSAIFGIAVLVSYLKLFLDMYQTKYPQKEGTNGSKATLMKAGPNKQNVKRQSKKDR